MFLISKTEKRTYLLRKIQANDVEKSSLELPNFALNYSPEKVYTMLLWVSCLPSDPQIHC